MRTVRFHGYGEPGDVLLPLAPKSFLHIHQIAYACGRLRTIIGRSVRAVVMTGDTRSHTVDSISAQGISVLIKPFTAEELLEALRGREKRE